MRVKMQCNGTAHQTTGILFSDLASMLESRGIDVELEMRDFPVGVLRKIGVLTSRVARSWRSAKNCDAIVVHTALSLSLPEIIFARLRRIPVVAFVWDIYPASTKAAGSLTNPIVLAAYSLSEKLAFYLVNRSLVPSEDYFEWVPGHKKNVTLFPLWPRGGVRQCRAAPTHDDEIVIAFAGQINSLRGIEYAVELIRERIPNCSIKIDVFSKDKLPASLGEATEHEGNLAIRRLGFVEPSEIGAVLSTYDFGLVSLDPSFALPSFPSKILTYLSAGIPVLYCGPAYSGLEKLVSAYGLGIFLTSGLGDRRDLRSFDYARFARGRNEFFTMSDEAADKLALYLTTGGQKPVFDIDDDGGV